LVLTHVHVDHVGRLPWVMAAGFKGPVFCTEPSAMLLPTVLEDAFLLGIRRDAQLADRFIKRVEPMLSAATSREWITVINRDDLVLRIRFHRAGHILGSAWVECDVNYPREKRRKRIIFSADLGAPHAPISPAPDIPYHAAVVDLLILHCARTH